MRKSDSSRHAGALVLLLTGTLITATASAQTYQVVDLGSLGGTISAARDVNTGGSVVGDSTLGVGVGNIHAFVWDGSISDLGTVDGLPLSVAFAINDVQEVVGASFRLGQLSNTAVKWSDGNVETLGEFLPRDVNLDCDIAGTMLVNSGGVWLEEAIFYSGGSITLLGTLGGGSSQAMGVTDDDRVCGSSFIADDTYAHAFHYADGVMSDLGTLGGDRSQALDMNMAGQIVGVSDTINGHPHAFLFTVDRSGQVTDRTDLGVLSGMDSAARGINASGQVVGVSNAAAFLWRDGTMSDLNDLITTPGWYISAADAINADGYIAATGILNGFPHAVLLVPGSIDCARVDRFTAKCRRGKLTVKVRSGLDEGTVLTVDNLGDRKTLTIDADGRGKVKYRNQTGPHTVFLVECPEFARDTDCGG